MQVKTKNLMVVGLGVALVLLLWWHFVYSSYESQTTKANQATADAETRLKALQSQVKVATGDPQKKKASLEDLQNAIPSTPALSAFLREVDKIRTDVGIPEAFQTITPSPPTVAGATASINLGITATGSYDQMINYVNRLNSLPRLVVIDNVQFTAGAAANSGGGGGGPTGKVFAGQGSAPAISVQLTARLFMTAAGTVTPSANGTAGANASGGGASTGVQNN